MFKFLKCVNIFKNDIVAKEPDSPFVNILMNRQPGSLVVSYDLFKFLDCVTIFDKHGSQLAWQSGKVSSLYRIIVSKLLKLFRQPGSLIPTSCLLYFLDCTSILIKDLVARQPGSHLCLFSYAASFILFEIIIKNYLVSRY